MVLTEEIIQKYVGGQIEVQEIHNGKVFRGEIKEIFFAYQGRKLDVTCAWGAVLQEDVWVDAHYCGAGYGLDLSQFTREDAEDGMIFSHKDFPETVISLYPPDNPENIKAEDVKDLFIPQEETRVR